MISRQDIIRVARSCVGTPFVHKGRAKSIGLDCVGLIQVVCTELNLVDYEWFDYRPMPRPGQVVEHFDKCFIRVDKYEPGDILVFWIRKPTLVMHSGILSDRGLIHAYGDVQKVVEHSFSEPWPSQVHCAYKFPGVD